MATQKSMFVDVIVFGARHLHIFLLYINQPNSADRFKLRSDNNGHVKRMEVSIVMS